MGKRKNTPAVPPDTTDNGAPAAPANGELVEMVRDPAEFPSPPHQADVHPAEVANMELAGWRVK